MLALRKCNPCSTLDFKAVGNKITMDVGIFWGKYWINENVDFLQIRHFFKAEMGKASSKSWIK